MNIQGRDPSLGMGMGGFEKSNRGEGGLRGVNAYGSSVGKKEKGIQKNGGSGMPLEKYLYPAACRG